MASAPTTTGNTPTYRPLFKRVGQNELKDARYGIRYADIIERVLDSFIRKAETLLRNVQTRRNCG